MKVWVDGQQLLQQCCVCMWQVDDYEWIVDCNVCDFWMVLEVIFDDELVYELVDEFFVYYCCVVCGQCCFVDQ